MSTTEERQTPARAQYLRIKRRHADALLLYRMGDFYELFDEDAVIASRDLHITLTSREFGKGNRVPMAGVPHHALASYLRRLLAKGHRVAICEQLSEAGYGLVERDVVRVLSPGTVSEPGLLPARENNYLVALAPGRSSTGLAYVDVSTGEFALTEFAAGEEPALTEELARLAPAECLIPENWEPAVMPACPATHCPPRWFAQSPAHERLQRHFATANLEAFGCAGRPHGSAAAAALLAYIEGTNRELLRLLRNLHAYVPGSYVALDAQTYRNLEITRTARAGERTGSLLSVLDCTRTAMGGRMLRRWLARPLRDLDALNRRLDAVGALLTGRGRRATLLAALDGAGDLERLAGRTRQGAATARDLLSLAGGLDAAANVRSVLLQFHQPTDDVDRSPSECAALVAIAERIDPCSELSELIRRAICTDDGRRIRTGYDAELDALTGAVNSAQRTLLEMEQQERERTGIRTLKVGFNKVFGYYIEVTRSNLKAVPPDFLRKQTLANAERFVTPALKEWEARILRAEEQITEREAELFASVCEAVGAQIDRLLTTAAALSELDILLAFADVSDHRRYVRPTLTNEDRLEISAGRHPVVEAGMDAESFIANDTLLEPQDGPGPRLMLITGPNMAGKSTYLRQAALIVLLAQVGCFVPAERAVVGLVDRIFTRIGAQDDLAAGASTFMVEMVETAAILRHATARSLLIFDEIGRGTSTLDGLAIAQAVIEEVHDRIRARTLFATHFHELIELEKDLDRLTNAHLTAMESEKQVVFLRRLAPGGADRSYGIQVARLAGLPESVTERAENLLEALEQKQAGTTEHARRPAVAEQSARYYPSATPVGALPTDEGRHDLAQPVSDPPLTTSSTTAVAPSRGAPESTLPGPVAAPLTPGACVPCYTRAAVEAADTMAAVNLAATTPMQALMLLFDVQERLRQTGCTCAREQGRPHLAVVAPVRPALGPAAP